MIATRTTPTTTMPNPMRQPGLPAYRPSDHPAAKSITIATAFDARRAAPTSRHDDERDDDRERREEHQQEDARGAGEVGAVQRREGLRIGQLVQPPAQGLDFGRRQHAPNHRRQRVEDSRCAPSCPPTWRRARSVASPRARSLKLPNRYIAASTIPHARLQPIAPASMLRVSAAAPSATLIDPVNVMTMITPNRISHVRSSGSSTCPEVPTRPLTFRPGWTTAPGRRCSPR